MDSFSDMDSQIGCPVLRISLDFPLQTKGNVADVDGTKPHLNNTGLITLNKTSGAFVASLPHSVLYHVKMSRFEQYRLNVFLKIPNSIHYV